MNNKIADRLRNEPMSRELLRDAINELDDQAGQIEMLREGLINITSQMKKIAARVSERP